MRQHRFVARRNPIIIIKLVVALRGPQIPVEKRIGIRTLSDYVRQSLWLEERGHS